MNNPLSSEYPVEQPQGKPIIDYKTLNTAGVGTVPRVTNAMGEAQLGIDELSRALENRFAQPNWLKVSAAFAKPQLGGFGASFGSAMDELGKQEEARRSIMPTVARMRAEIGAGQVPFTQGLTQQQLFAQFEKKPTPELGLQILNFGSDTPAAKAVLEYFPTLQTIAGTKSTEQSTRAREQEALKVDPYYVPLDKDLQKDWNTVAQERNQAFSQGLLDSGLYNAEQVAKLTPQQLQASYEAVTKQQAEKRLTDSNESGSVLSGSMNNLSQLGTARELAKSKDMEKLLGIGSGQTAVSALFGFVAHPNDPAGYSRLSAAAQKLAKDDPELYSKFVVLQKALNTNVSQARETLSNPSNQATSLLQSTYPNVTMPQQSIVNLLDLMAAQNMRDARLAAWRQSLAYRDINPNKAQSDEAFRMANDELEQEKAAILEGKYFKQAKKPHNLYYSGRFYEGLGNRQPQQPAQPRQPSARPSTGRYTGNDALSQQLGIGTNP